MGVKGAGDGGRGGGERVGGGRGIFGAGFISKCVVFYRFYFYVLQCNNWVSEVSNRRTGVNSGIFTMNPAFLFTSPTSIPSQPWFTLNSFGLNIFYYIIQIQQSNKFDIHTVRIRTKALNTYRVLLLYNVYCVVDLKADCFTDQGKML